MVDGSVVSPNETDVLIVEEYIPEYRRGFFERLDDTLGLQSIRLTVATGTASDAHVARSDAVDALPFVHHVPSRSISIMDRRLAFKRLSGLARISELVVVDQALRHLESYPLLLGQRRGPRVALWGHGPRRERSTWLEGLERLAVRSAHWFFAYTKNGADRVAATGFPRDRITVVQNTIDVGELAALRRQTTEDEQQRLREELGIPPENVCLFIGALDRSKRISFLLEACAIVAGRLPEFALVVAGDGEGRPALEASLASNPWLRYVGRATGRRKAVLGSVSDVLLMPGSVGLVAVDSFALSTPIITTEWPLHGPEFDYLENGLNARVARNSVLEFARTIECTLKDRAELARLKGACEASASRYSLETMVMNFADGVVAALGADRR
jgi:glycosyltransferase involved in cell wall biosynthesis